MIAALRAAYPLVGVMAAYVGGLAFGVGLGRTFAPLPAKRSRWISDEYKQLTGNCHEVATLIRLLLRGQRPVAPALRPCGRGPAAVVRWNQSAGRAAREHAGLALISPPSFDNDYFRLAFQLGLGRHFFAPSQRSAWSAMAHQRQGSYRPIDRSTGGPGSL